MRLPGLSKIAPSAGFTVRISVPFAFPVNDTPSKIVLVPLPDKLDGKFFESFAVPPVNENTKSAASRSPVPSFLLNTFSLKKTCRKSLLSAILTESIMAGTISFKVVVLFC